MNSNHPELGNVRANYDAEDYGWATPRLLRLVEEGADATLRYESRFGDYENVQEVSGAVEFSENYMGSRDGFLVGGRRLDSGGRVYSEDSGRVVGEVVEFEVVLSFEDALEIIDRNSDGYDVDYAGDGPVIVQFWAGPADDPEEFWGMESRFEVVED